MPRDIHQHKGTRQNTLVPFAPHALHNGHLSMFWTPELLKNPAFVSCLTLGEGSSYPRIRVFRTPTLALSQRPTNFLPRSARGQLQH